ncbi:hypothetical protein ACIGXM_36765 [Kitasatospora sp. NPDC052896]|uniref:hypothetical protein n=1 Tax=Kitasatospora sp. NPDC052896 TaxID=3364061 RepID=UPI0037C58F5A
MQVRSDPDLHFALRVVIPTMQPEGRVGLSLGFGFGVAQDVDHAAGLVDEGGDPFFGQGLGAAGARGGLESCFRSGPLGLGFGDPSSDGSGGSGVGGGEGLAVAGELLVAGGDLGAGFDLRGLVARRGERALGGIQPVDGGGAAAGGEAEGKPAVEVGDDVSFPENHVPGVGDLVGQGVLLGVAAAAVRLLVGPLTAHLPTAQDTVDPAAQQVGVDGTNAVA